MNRETQIKCVEAFIEIKVGQPVKLRHTILDSYQVDGPFIQTFTGFIENIIRQLIVTAVVVRFVEDGSINVVFWVEMYEDKNIIYKKEELRYKSTNGGLTYSKTKY